MVHPILLFLFSCVGHLLCCLPSPSKSSQRARLSLYNNTQWKYHLLQPNYVCYIYYFILHYMFRPISRPSSGAIWQITKRSSYWVISPWIHRVMILL
jgi:hypothetical protein